MELIKPKKKDRVYLVDDIDLIGDEYRMKVRLSYYRKRKEWTWKIGLLNLLTAKITVKELESIVRELKKLNSKS